MCVLENRGLWRNPLLLFKISKNLKKISYQPRRNLLQPQIVKNLLPKWSVFVRIFYKNNSNFSFFLAEIYLRNLRYLFVFIFFYMDFYILGLPTLNDVLYLNVFYNVVCNKSNHNHIKYVY
jgi:hypothetical protein